MPEGWRRQRLGNVAEIILGQSPPSADVTEIEGGFPFLQGNAEFGERHPRPSSWVVAPPRTAPSMATLVSVRAPVGDVNRADMEYGIGRGVAAVVARNGAAVQDYLFWVLANAEPYFNSRKQGSTFDAINKTDLIELPVLLPPLPEQQKIAVILSSVDDAIAATRRVIEQAKRVKQGLLQTLMTRGIGHTRFKKTPIGEIPEAWEVAPVEEHFDTQLGKMLNKKARIGPNQRPYVGNAQVQWTRVALSNVGMMHFDDSEAVRFSLREGDLLVCEGGEIGRTAIWMGEVEDCYFQKAIHRLRPRDSYVPRFFLRYMMLAAVIGRFSGFSARTSISHLTQEKLRRMPIPVPPPEEQEEIATIFDAVDAQIDRHEMSARTMASLKRGLMQDLLTGRVRVNPD